MGTSTSKKGLKKNAELAYHQCECLPFRFQSFCTSNRHMHAYIEANSLDICIVDLTYSKRFAIKNVIDSSEQLQNETSLPPGLTQCNLIAYHWDLAVVQVFYRKSVQFCICDCSSQTCRYRYIMCPCSKRTPGLCEAYFTTNRQFLILKASDFYYNMFSTSCPQLDTYFIEIANIEDSKIISNHYSFSDLGIIPFGLCPDPQRQTDVYFSCWKCDVSAETGYGYYMFSNLSLVDVSFPFKGRPVNTSNGDFSRRHEAIDIAPDSEDVGADNVCRFALVNIQIPRNGGVIFQSTASRISKERFLPSIVGGCTIQVEMREKKLGGAILRTWNYDSYAGVQLDWPKLSPSGAYAVVGDQMCLLPARCSVKSLATQCTDLLVELLLPEDIQFLPLPEKLKNSLKYGDSVDLQQNRKYQFKTTSV